MTPESKTARRGDHSARRAWTVPNRDWRKPVADTLADPPPETPSPLATREDALKFMIGGHSSASLLALAASPSAVADAAAGTGRPAREIRAYLLALSAEVGDLEAEGLTVDGCWDELAVSPGFVGMVRAAQALRQAPVPAQSAA